MKKELIMPIIIIAVIVVIMILIFSLNGNSMINENNSSDTVQVNGAQFTLPPNYVIGPLNKNNHTTIEHGNDKIYLSSCNDNITHEVDNYLNNLENRSLKGNFTTTKIDNTTTLYKVTVDNGTTTHYWFKLNKKGYTIYSWGKINNLDKIVRNLVKSAISNK